MFSKETKTITDKKEALHLLSSYCSHEERCESDVLTKIKSYNISEELTEELIEFLKDQKFFDNKRYAAAFVNDKFKFNKWGKTKISYSLSQKRIPSALIHEALENINEDDYYELLSNEIRKKASSTKSASLFEKKSKLYRFALSRGFESDLIMKVLDQSDF